MLLAAASAAGQTFSLGVVGGVPVSPESQQDSSTHFFAKPYAVGPIVEVGIRWGISVQASGLYERFHIDQAQGLTVGRGSGSIDFGHQYSVGANAWQFPLLLRYTRGRGRVAPFVDAGATLRHLGEFTGKGTQVDFYLQSHPAEFRVSSGRDLDAAITAGAGVRWRAGMFDIEPELRFLHWTSPYYQPAQNQAMLMLAITFR